MGMDQDATVSLAQIDEIIAEAGRILAWTPAYANLLATTATRVFAALGNPAAIPVGRRISGDQIATMSGRE